MLIAIATMYTFDQLDPKWHARISVFSAVEFIQSYFF